MELCSVTPAAGPPARLTESDQYTVSISIYLSHFLRRPPRPPRPVFYHRCHRLLTFRQTLQTAPRESIPAVGEKKIGRHQQMLTAGRRRHDPPVGGEWASMFSCFTFVFSLFPTCPLLDIALMSPVSVFDIVRTNQSWFKGHWQGRRQPSVHPFVI